MIDGGEKAGGAFVISSYARAALVIKATPPVVSLLLSFSIANLIMRASSNLIKPPVVSIFNPPFFSWPDCRGS